MLGYCKNSANPVGHLVLYVCGYRDASASSSPTTCTALQLANFWQDVAVDYTRGGSTVPLESLAKFGVSEGDIAQRRATPQFREMMNSKCGARVVCMACRWRRSRKHLAINIELFSRGGWKS